MADSQKTGGDAAYTFPHDFVVSADFRPHAERLTGTISPWTAEAVPATRADAETGTAAAAETGARAGTGAKTEAEAAAAEPGTTAGAEIGTAATAKKGAQERVWVITNMKANGRSIVEGKVFVQDSGAIVGMEFAGEINHIAFSHIQALCAMAPEVAGRHEIEKGGLPVHVCPRVALDGAPRARPDGLSCRRRIREPKGNAPASEATETRR